MSEELLASIRANPEDDGNYLVYGDWLQAQGDPRGELIALQHARLGAPSDKRLRGEEAQLIGKHRDRLLGSLAKNLDSLHLQWHLGFIHGARVLGGPSLRGERRLEDLLEDLFNHSSAEFLQGLSLGEFRWQRNTHGTAQVLIDRFAEPFSALRELFLFDQIGARGADISGLMTKRSRLRSLSLCGDFELGSSVDMPQLEYLSIRTDDLEVFRHCLGALASSELPSLGELCLWCPTELDVDVLMHTVDCFPTLKVLRLWRLTSTQSFVTALTARPLAQQLEHLDLTAGRMNAAGAKLLANAKQKLPLLQRLQVDGNRLTNKACAVLRAAFPVVEASCQLRSDHPELQYWSEGDNHSFMSIKAECLLGDTLAARDAFAVLERSGGGGHMLFNRSAMMMIRGDTTVALPLLKASLELPNSRFIKPAWENAGICYAGEGDFETAIEIARRAMLDYPDVPNLYAILIDALRHLRRMPEAIEEANFSEHLVNTSNEGMALLQDCMLTYLVAGTENRAIELYEQFVDANGNPRSQAMACAVIAYCHADSGSQAREILDEVEAADCSDLIVEHARACLAMLNDDIELARKALGRARAGGYVEMRFCDNEDSLLSSLASQPG